MSAAEDKNDWRFWRDSLAGQRPAVVMGEPRTGYYRRKFTNRRTGEKVDDAIAIWFADGWKAKIGPDRGITGTDEVFDVFQSCCKTAVTYEHYQHAIAHKVWPTDLPAELEEKPAGIGDNSGDVTPLVEITDEVKTARAAFDRWLKEIGGSILTQDQADLAGSYADKGSKLASKAEGQRKIEKQPHLDAGRAVDEAWRDPIAVAEDLKRDAKRAVEPFLKAEAERRRRAAEEAAAKIAQERAASLAAAAPGEAIPAPETPAVEATPVRAGGAGGRRVALRKVKRVRILDAEKAKAAYLQTPTFLAGFNDWIAKFGPTAPVPIPGTEQFEEEVAV